MQSGKLNKDFQLCIDHLVNYGSVTKPRGQETRELLNYNITVQDPRNRVITFPSRKINTAYLLGELVWYLIGENTVDGILPFSKFWANITNSGNVLGYPKGTINSNYGHRIFGHANTPGFVHAGEQLNQWEILKDILRKDPDSRQAILNIHMPSDRHEGNKDVACTLTLQFFIREGALHMIVNMRSNDIIRGFGNDVFQFSMLQEILLVQLREHFPDLELGHYFHNAGSMHLYDVHYEMADNILQEAMPDVSMIAMDVFNAEILDGLARITDNFIDMRMNNADLPETFEGYAGYELLSPYWKACVDGLYLRSESALHVLFGQDEDHDHE